MKRLITFALLAFAFTVPVAMIGCGDDKKAAEPIKSSDLKVPPKDTAK